MKKIVKLMVAAMIVAAMAITTANAQTTPINALRFGIGLEVANPTGNARLGSHFVMGGTARFQYGLSNSLAVTVTSGAYHFFPIKIPGTDTRYKGYGVIPIKAGIKAFFAPNFYFGAEGGIGIEVTDAGTGPTRLLLSPALGYANEYWDLGFHYDNISGTTDKYGLIALRLAYGFKL